MQILFHLKGRIRDKEREHRNFLTRSNFPLLPHALAKNFPMSHIFIGHKTCLKKNKTYKLLRKYRLNPWTQYASKTISLCQMFCLSSTVPTCFFEGVHSASKIITREFTCLTESMQESSSQETNKASRPVGGGNGMVSKRRVLVFTKWLACWQEPSGV